MMRQNLFIANWKMNHVLSDMKSFVAGLKDLRPKSLVAVCPSLPYLLPLYQLLETKNVLLGAQNCYFANSGAFTGEASVSQLKDCGVKLVLVGHSERRHVFFESNETTALKLNAVLNAGLLAVLCIGETENQREANKTFEVIHQQLESALKDKFDLTQMVIAYEPVWAIGTGKNATPEQAEAVHLFIRQWIQKSFGETFASNLKILYGGSVKPDNSAELMRQTNIDGLLIGGASLLAESFCKIIAHGESI